MATQTSINCQLDSKYVSTVFCNTVNLLTVINITEKLKQYKTYYRLKLFNLEKDLKCGQIIPVFSRQQNIPFNSTILLLIEG